MTKILAIDDNRDNLVTLSALLKNMMPECTVITALSGMDGIEKAERELPDIILLDIIMPVMDGFETCRRLMADENTKHIPVVMITAIKTDSRSRIRGLEIGANAFFAKPIDEIEMVSQIKVALRIKQAEDALRVERDSLEERVRERTAALTASEKRHRTILRTAMEGFWLVDTEGRVMEVNEAYCRMSGYSEKELLAMRISDLEAAEARDETAAHIRKFMARGGDRFETRHRRKDGSIYDVEASVQYLPLDGGRCVGFLRDITQRKHAEEQLNQTLERLKKAINTTMQVIVSTVEARDPYTANHQIRCAVLASAIATEMGLPQDRIEGIRIAGSIHDLGKLSIPAEILSKPVKLSELEFSLIKEHSRKGYDILKNVESSWPLAEIVYQHHERMDGSGYPRNLKGDEILMEARILAVCDVVESMASHRPYRAALGVDAALKEIENNRGVLYDTDVVDVCLKLFREKGYRFE